MGYTMNGFSGFGNSPVKQKKKEKWESYYPLTEEQKNTPTDEEKDAMIKTLMDIFNVGQLK